MYLGEIVEFGRAEEVFEPPYHPYTRSLLSAIPEPDPLWEGDRVILEGNVPSPIDPPSGCKFHTRCPIAHDECAEWDEHPDLVDAGGTHGIGCPYYEEVEGGMD